jgi:hypothetical protein
VETTELWHIRYSGRALNDKKTPGYVIKERVRVADTGETITRQGNVCNIVVDISGRMWAVDAMGHARVMGMHISDGGFYWTVHPPEEGTYIWEKDLDVF